MRYKQNKNSLVNILFDMLASLLYVAGLWCLAWLFLPSWALSPPLANAGCCPGHRHSHLRLRTSEQGGSRCARLCSAHSPPRSAHSSSASQCAPVQRPHASQHSLPRGLLISASPRGGGREGCHHRTALPLYTAPCNPSLFSSLLHSCYWIVVKHQYPAYVIFFTPAYLDDFTSKSKFAKTNAIELQIVCVSIHSVANHTLCVETTHCSV